MITKEQAINAQEFHYGKCEVIVGPRGGRRYNIETWRRNGKTRTWVTRPKEFIVPVKHGLRDCYNLTWYDAHLWHMAEDCKPEVV